MSKPDIRWLYDGNRKTGLSVRPDPKWPGMWRIHYPDGEVSDMVNISRATDAAVRWAAANVGSKDARRMSWKEAPEIAFGSTPHRVSETKA